MSTRVFLDYLLLSRFHYHLVNVIVVMSTHYSVSVLGQNPMDLQAKFHGSRQNNGNVFKMLRSFAQTFAVS